MLNQKLTARNTYLTEMLKQAGLDAQARDVAERIQTVLTDEIHHRMKNMLTMVTAIVRQSMRASASLVEAEAAISLRLLAMARAHDLLLKPHHAGRRRPADHLGCHSAFDPGAQ